MIIKTTKQIVDYYNEADSFSKPSIEQWTNEKWVCVEDLKKLINDMNKLPHAHISSRRTNPEYWDGVTDGVLKSKRYLKKELKRNE